MYNNNQDVVSNQSEKFIHLTIGQDLAYQYSVDNNDPVNMQMVLRAHGEAHTLEAAELQIQIAKHFA